MADDATILELRRLINELTNEEPWTDLLLSVRIDEWEGDLRLLAASIWREKAASYSSLVDIQEGNSNRKLSQLYSQALKMAEGLSNGVVDVTVTPRRSGTRAIERV